MKKKPQPKSRFIQNDEAVSISLGFILTFSISVLIFVAIILSFYTLSDSSEKTAMRGSFDIMGSELGVKITIVDTMINITNTYGGTVNKLEYEFSVPASIANEGYSVNVTNSTKQVIIQADNGAISWIPFNTSANITQTMVYSNSQCYEFNYTNNIYIATLGPGLC